MEKKVEQLEDSVFNLVSQSNGTYDKNVAIKFIENELNSLGKSQIRKIAESLLIKFKRIENYYDKTEYWKSFRVRSEDTRKMVKKNIRKNIIKFYIDLQKIIEKLDFKHIIQDLGIGGQFSMEIRNDIFELLIKQADKDALIYIKKYLEESNLKEFYEFIKFLPDSRYSQEIIEMIVEISNKTIERLISGIASKENTRKSIITSISNSLIEILKNKKEYCETIILNFCDSEGDIENTLYKVIKYAGQRFTEAETSVFENLITALIGDDIKDKKTNLIINLINEICKFEDKLDRGELLGIILTKSKSLNDEQKRPLRNLLNILTNIKFENQTQWKNAIQIVLDKIDSDISFSRQIKFIEETLRDNGFTIELQDFNDSLEKHEIGERGSIGLIRNTYEGLLKNLANKFGGGRRLDYDLLETEGILKETVGNRSDEHLEKNFSIKLYGLLSHYGSHPNEITPEIGVALFYVAIVWITLILKNLIMKCHISE